MFTQEDKQEILTAIGGLREITEANREAIGGLREITEANREAIGSVREITEGNRTAIEANREAIGSVRSDIALVRNDIHDNAEAIALLAEQMEEHRTETRRSFVDVREYVDRRVLDLEVKMGSPTRYTNRQVKRVVEKLHEKRIFNTADVTDVLSMSAFSKEA